MHAFAAGASLCHHLQAYAMLHIAADGKLPRITAMLHVEGFHALCQHPELVTMVGLCWRPVPVAVAVQAGSVAGSCGGFCSPHRV